ncbi:MAG: hypothetical protein HY481_02675 [Candidatus Vogelbacteria bacterium]|nr:hypothetical protein [Candidatus Vogelbacteria bacterium]
MIISKTIHTFHTFTAAILTLALLGQFLAPLAAFAQSTELPPADTSVGPPSPDIVGLPGGPAGPPSDLAPLPPGRPKNPAQILAEARRDDARACQAESTAGTGVSAFKPESLQNALADDIGKSLPPILDDTLKNDLPIRLQSALQRELGSIVSDGLRRELPRRLAPQLQGLTQVQYENQFPTILNETIKDALPDILRDGLDVRLPRIAAESVRGSLGARLGPGLNSATEVFVRAQFGGEISGKISEIFGFMVSYIGDLISSITAMGEGMIASGTALQNSLATCFGGGFSGLSSCAQALEQGKQLVAQGRALIDKTKEIGEFLTWLQNRQANQEQMTEDIIQGLTVTIQESLTQGDTMERLTDALAADITGPVIRSLEGGMDNITAAFLGPVNRAIGSIENLPNVFFDPINDAVNNLVNTTTGVIDAQIRAITSAITAPIDAITRAMSQTIEQTMTAALKPLTDTLTGAFAEAGNFIAAPMNIGAQQINDYFSGNTDVTLTPGSGPLYPNSYYQPPQVLDPTTLPGYSPGIGEIGSPLAGPPAELPLTDTITGMASEGAGAASGATQGIAEQAVNNQITAGNLTGSIGTTFAQGLTGAVGATLGGLVAGVPFVGGALQNMVNNFVNQAAAALGLSAVVGLAVPTMEIGALLSTEQSTNQITGQIKGINEQMKKTQEQLLKVTAEIKALQIESCTYLKTIRRIQLAFEAKEFVQDPDAKKAIGRAIEDHNIRLFEGLKAGRAPGNAENLDPKKDKGPVVPKNLNAALDQGRQEVTGAFLDELKNIDSPFKDDIKAKLAAEQTETFAERIKPTISQEEYRKITSGEDFSWDTWLELIKPQNTPAGAEFLAREELARRQAANEQNIREELLAGLGFLNTDECVKYSDDGKWCIERKTLTPGSVIQGYAVEGLTSVIRKTEGTEILDDYLTPELEINLERLKDISNYAGASAGTVYNQPDPCPGPGPCPDSGWGKIPAAKPVTPSAPGGSGDTTSPPVGETIIRPEISNNVLTLNLSFETPTLAEVESGDKTNATTLKWRATNAEGPEACIASNDWLSGQTAAPLVANGSPLPASGERRVQHPINLDLRAKVSNAAAGLVTSDLLVVKSIASDQLRYRAVLDVRTAAIEPDNVYRLTLGADDGELAVEVGGAGLVNPPTPATVVQLLQREISQWKQSETPLAAELNKYLFTGFSGGTLTITPRLTYGLTCYQGASQVSQSVEIRRR